MGGWLRRWLRKVFGGYFGTGVLGVATAVGAVLLVGQSDLALAAPPRLGASLPFSFQPKDLASTGPLIYGNDIGDQGAALDAEQRALPRLTAGQLVALP